jgi:hypothetical protein
MACTALVDILKGCDSNIGGVSKVYINDMTNITAETVVTADHEVTARTVSSPYVEFEFSRNVSSFTEEAQINFENGSTFWMTTVAIKLFKREAAKSRAIQIAGQGQRDLSLIVLDTNGVYWDVPYSRLTTDAAGSGTAKADGSAYDITFTADNTHKLYVIDPTIIAALLV